MKTREQLVDEYGELKHEMMSSVSNWICELQIMDSPILLTTAEIIEVNYLKNRLHKLLHTLEAGNLANKQTRKGKESE